MLAGTLAAGTNGFIVNAGASDVVTLRGLSVHGFGTGLNGVNFLAGKALVVEDCVFESFAQNGISFTPTAAASLTVRNVLMRSIGTAANNSGAIRIAPNTTSPNTGSAGFTIDRLQVSESYFGLSVAGPANGLVRDSTFASSGSDGAVLIGAATATVDVSLDNVAITDSIQNGLRVQDANAIARLSRSTITGNAQGLATTAGGQIVSYGDNRNSGNVSNGAPTQTIGQQ
jgi:hypothetical protein